MQLDSLRLLELIKILHKLHSVRLVVVTRERWADDRLGEDKLKILTGVIVYGRWCTVT